MANLEEEAVWEEGVYQIKTTDLGEGGPDGLSNRQAKELANRTAYLLANKVDKEESCPVGSPYEQHLNDPEPKERGLPGDWEIWSFRADGYGLSSTALPAYTTYTAGANYAVNAYVMYHLNGDNYEIYKAKEAISGAPAQLDPVKWTKFTPGVIVERRDLQAWTDADFTIGTQISDGGMYDGWYVCEVIVPGGKFNGVEGGNRPTFKDGGVAGDAIRDIEGTIDEFWGGHRNQTGVFESLGVVQGAVGGEATATKSSGSRFKASLVVQTGPENSPRELSKRLWRRVS